MMLFVARRDPPGADSQIISSQNGVTERNGKTGTDAAALGSVHVSHSEDCVMLYWAAVFFVIALLAAIFGFGGLAASAAGVAKVLFFVFLVFALVSFLFGRRSAA